MRPHGDAVDRDVDARAAGADELERIGDPPGVERVKRRRPALVAPFDEKPRGGVDGSSVRRMRLRAEAPEIGVDEAGVDPSALELRAPQELA